MSLVQTLRRSSPTPGPKLLRAWAPPPLPAPTFQSYPPISPNGPCLHTLLQGARNRKLLRVLQDPAETSHALPSPRRQSFGRAAAGPHAHPPTAGPHLTALAVSHLPFYPSGHLGRQALVSGRSQIGKLRHGRRALAGRPVARPTPPGLVCWPPCLLPMPHSGARERVLPGQPRWGPNLKWTKYVGKRESPRTTTSLSGSVTASG